ALFDIPREVAYLNAASYSPLPLAVQEAGRRGVARKGRPWLVDQAFALAHHERARAAAARLIDARPAEVALVSSIAYGVASGRKALVPPPGARVRVVEDDLSSRVLEWRGRQEAGGFRVEPVARPADGDWTAAVLGAIARRGAAPVALASLSAVHWADGVS